LSLLRPRAPRHRLPQICAEDGHRRHQHGRKRPLRIYAPLHVKKVVKLVTSHFVAETVSTPYKTTFRRVSSGVPLDLPGLRVEVAEACHHTAKEAYAHWLSAGVDVLFSSDTALQYGPLRRPGAGVDVAVLDATRNEENKPLCKRMPTPPPSRRWRRGDHKGGGTGDYTQMTVLTQPHIKM
jgi:hypothetical protein